MGSPNQNKQKIDFKRSKIGYIWGESGQFQANSDIPSIYINVQWRDALLTKGHEGQGASSVPNGAYGSRHKIRVPGLKLCLFLSVIGCILENFLKKS